LYYSIVSFCKCIFLMFIPFYHTEWYFGGIHTTAKIFSKFKKL
jgi:hypothetical protein